MKLFVHQLRTEQLLFWRNREAAFFTFFLPVIFFLIFGAIYGDTDISSEHIKGSYFLEAGMIGYGVASTCFAGLGITLVVRRELGILKRVRTTPLTPLTYLSAVLGSIFIVFLFEAALIILIGRVLFGVPFPTQAFSVLVVLLIGAVCFAAMGLGISGFVRSTEGSSAAINAVYLPMAIISGTFFTPKGYPTFLKVIADALPLTHYTKVTRDVMVHGVHVWSDWKQLLVVLAWGIAGMLAALKLFRWQPREA